MFTTKKRILETFIELVKVYSPSTQEEKLAKLMLEKLSLLNLSSFQDEFGNIIARLPAKQGINAPTIFFSAHLDVVEPCEKVEPIVEEIEGDKIIRSSGTTVLGADDKAGLAMILEALTCIVEQDLDHGEIEIVLTLQEETGLRGSKALVVENLKSEFGYILDHSAPVGVAINKAPQHDKMKFIFKGKAAHAGLKPEEGKSAILLASKAISKMPIGKLDEESTANVGTISGGVATNIVPYECVVTCEVRSHDIKKVNKYVQAYVDAANEAVKDFPGTSVNYLRETEYRNISIKQDEAVLRYAKIAAEKLGLEFKLKITNGGSDANVLNHKGLTCVCLGCGYHDPHSTSEWIAEKDLALGAEYVVALIQSVISNKHS